MRWKKAHSFSHRKKQRASTRHLVKNGVVIEAQIDGMGDIYTSQYINRFIEMCSVVSVFVGHRAMAISDTHKSVLD